MFLAPAPNNLLLLFDLCLKVHGVEEVDAAIQEMSAQFEKLLQTNKTSSSDSGKGHNLYRGFVQV